jgi:hypothetical protein
MMLIRMRWQKKHVFGNEAKRSLQGRATKLMFCGSDFPFSSLSLCSKNFMFHRVVGCFHRLARNGFGLCVGGLLKPQTVCQHQTLLIAQMFLFALTAH